MFHSCDLERFHRNANIILVNQLRWDHFIKLKLTLFIVENKSYEITV
jgi:hypothetical protein